MAKKTKEIKSFILHNVKDHSKDISPFAAKHFGTSRQAISRHVATLVDEGLLSASGKTKARVYELKNIVQENMLISVNSDLREDLVWREKIIPLLGDINKNILDICQFGFTEILNNVVDHSESENTFITVIKNPISIEFGILDRGVGIFNKLQKYFGFDDPRHALLELSKGNLTSSPRRHAGQGTFYTSRMFDSFTILSGSLFYEVKQDSDGWIYEVDEEKYKDREQEGTFISMSIDLDCNRTYQGVMNKYSPGADTLAITTTHVPIILAKYKGEELVSRSQAKRLLAKLSYFKEVLLDFQGITSIGPAFADEIFRVYRLDHPDVSIIHIRANPDIERVIEKVKKGGS